MPPAAGQVEASARSASGSCMLAVRHGTTRGRSSQAHRRGAGARRLGRAGPGRRQPGRRARRRRPRIPPREGLRLRGLPAVRRWPGRGRPGGEEGGDDAHRRRGAGREVRGRRPRAPARARAPAAVPLPVDRRRDGVHQPARSGAAQPLHLPLPPPRDPGRLARRGARVPADERRQARPGERAARVVPAGAPDLARPPRRQPLARAAEGRPEPGNLDAARSAARPHPDGDGLGQDLHGDHRDLPHDQVR